MFGWLFGHKKDHPDIPGFYLDKAQTIWFPLVCDANLYAAGVDAMRQILVKWINEDRATSADTGQDISGTVSFLLNGVDLKFLPYSEQCVHLLEVMSTNTINRSGMRLLDAITLIYTVVPTEVVETFKGKFFYGMLMGLPKEMDDLKFPTDEDWVELYRLVPWAPFLILIQEILNDEQYSKPQMKPEATEVNLAN